jgi:hypothetical protein
MEAAASTILVNRCNEIKVSLLAYLYAGSWGAWRSGGCELRHERSYLDHPRASWQTPACQLMPRVVTCQSHLVRVVDE